mmetsp:Transcript_28843/g.48736  ORF Transcript_28843/g.48736 Transcript_28843/m.48736 type:complete len:256 (+) Transcript_28843:133-900(+)
MKNEKSMANYNYWICDAKFEWPLTENNFKAGFNFPPRAAKKSNAEAAQKEATAASVATSESPTPRRWIITLAAIVAMLATLFAVVSLASMSSSQEIFAAVSTRMQFEAINQTGMQMPTNFSDSMPTLQKISIVPTLIQPRGINQNGKMMLTNATADSAFYFDDGSAPNGHRGLTSVTDFAWGGGPLSSPAQNNANTIDSGPRTAGIVAMGSTRHQEGLYCSFLRPLKDPGRDSRKLRKIVAKCLPTPTSYSSSTP